jgi:uncharacterized protein YecT (DUF1311 family)
MWNEPTTVHHIASRQCDLANYCTDQSQVLSIPDGSTNWMILSTASRCCPVRDELGGNKVEWAIGFILGFSADLLRSVLLPATTEWVNRLIPSARRKANTEENMLVLEVMQRLVSLGKNPDLAKHIRGPSDRFMKLLTDQREAFVEHAIELIDARSMTQAEMTVEARRRAEVAIGKVEHSVQALKLSGLLNRQQLAKLQGAQRNWEKYAHAQAELTSAEFADGSIAPLIFQHALEEAAVIRASELRRLLEELRERELNQ